jgi:hypothetical protein
MRGGTRMAGSLVALETTAAVMVARIRYVGSTTNEYTHSFGHFS